uniref:Cytochrome P450 71A1-like n=1 Tax=Nelumbo nucifera TaxID=4432 RepID=A0A822Z6P0_NELNU|nr:TPA_asm: hypothetical protein HUJ06_013654 [Nelumbo nucifera]
MHRYSYRIGWRLKRTSQELDKLLDQVIRDHVSTTDDQRSKDQREGEDFLHILLQDMFIGGSDMTAITVEWSMTELIRNPKVMRKAQEEVRRVVGKKSKFEEDDIPQMAYLKAVTKETLRLHPPASFFIPRESIRAINVNGYHIPAKTRVFIDVWAIEGQEVGEPKMEEGWRERRIKWDRFSFFIVFCIFNYFDTNNKIINNS